MFRFLRGEKGKTPLSEKRKKNDSRSTSRVGSNRSNGPQKQKSTGNKPSRESRRPPKMKSLDQFFDSMSIESSLYTTPSKPTIQYPRKSARTSDNIEWYSSQGSDEQGLGTKFTAELALVQYRLGGWQSPPNIESSLTPNTETTFSSESPPKSVQDTETINDETELTEVNRSSCSDIFTDSGDKVPLVSASLCDVDVDPLLFKKAEEYHLEVCSIASSEISWNYDSREYNEENAFARTGNHYDNMTTIPGQNIIAVDEEEKDIRRNMGDDAESVCSSVSSLSTNQVYYDTPKSNISEWSPMHSPASITHDRVTSKIKSVSSSHDNYESPLPDGSTSQGTEFSRKNDSLYSEGDSMVNLNDDEQVSFSELMSRCEGESLAERLAPYASPPGTRMFGTPIDMNSSDNFQGSSSLDLSQVENEESPSKNIELDCPLGPKEKNGNMVTQKITNTSTSLSDCNDMVPISTVTAPGVQVETQTIEDSRYSNDSSSDSIEFGSILSRCEAQSLGYGMGSTQILTEVKKKDENSHCTDDGLNYSQHDQTFEKEASIGSSPSCHEDILSRATSARSECSKENVISGNLQAPNKPLLETSSNDKVLPPFRTQYIGIHNFKRPIAPSNIQQEKTLQQIKTSNKMYPEEVVHDHMTSKSPMSVSDQCPYDGPVDLDEISTNGLQLETKNLEKEVNCNKTSESNFSLQGEVMLDNPDTSSANAHRSASTSPMNVYQPSDFHQQSLQIPSPVSSIQDKDNLNISIWDDDNDEDEDIGKMQSQFDCNSSTCSYDDREAIDQSYKEAMASINASKQVQVPSGCNFKGPTILREDELTRHQKLMEQCSPLPNLMGAGYDSWKREKEFDRLYFEELDKKLASQKVQDEELQLASSENSHDRIAANVLPNAKSLVEKTKDSTTSEILPQRRRIKSLKFLVRILFRNDDDHAVAKKEKSKKKKQNKKEKEAKKTQISSVVNIDKFMLSSNGDNTFDSDDFADLSLFPLNQLEHLTKNISHNDLGKKICDHLVWERKRQWLAEIDKEKDEWCEQIRISILKEQELERQRKLNCPELTACVPCKEASLGPSLNLQKNDVHTGSNLGGIVNHSKMSQEGYLHYDTPQKYLCEKSRITASTTRESESLGSCSINSFLHTNLSFDTTPANSLQAATSLNTPMVGSTIPPCVVCKVAERTHISLPCMHYSFCSECAEGLQRIENPVCPVCQTQGIKVSKVYT